jgi:hypothetical protein
LTRKNSGQHSIALQLHFSLTTIIIMWPKTDLFRLRFIVAVSVILVQCFLAIAISHKIQSSPTITKANKYLGLYAFIQGQNVPEKHILFALLRLLGFFQDLINLNKIGFEF